MRAVPIIVVFTLSSVGSGCLPEVDFTPCEQRDTCPITDASDATNDLVASDVADADASSGASDASDVIDVSDASDASDVSDASDASDVINVSDASDASDVINVSDATAVVDVSADVTCIAGERNCGGACRTVQDDPLNCGACGRACRADQVCASGACECATARSECGGVCRNLATDTSNCGLCGRACASGSCVSGACTCPAGQTECAGACRNVTTDAANCGRCGVVCRSGACVAGVCVPEQRSCATAGTVGCGLVELAGGTFSMGAAAECFGSNTDPTCANQGSPVQPMITVSAFAIDAFEVTVARFRVFWNARMADGGASNRAAPVAYPGGRFITWDAPGNEPQPMGAGPSCNWNRVTGTRDAHPINCVEWRMAQEFCVWDGGRLPTEAEWEYVARGRPVADEGLVQGRYFPWGNYSASYLCDRAHVQGCPGDDAGLTRRVGSYTANGGVFDLAGNIDEWTADTYALYSDAMCWSMPRQTNPLCTTASASSRTSRGGSFNDRMPRSASRYDFGSATPTAFVGLRCARSR